MKNGKVSQTVLKRSVLKQIHNENPRVILGPGADAACFSAGSSEEEGWIVSATETVGVGSSDLAARTVCAAVNNVAACGAEPVGAELSLCVPTLWSESQIRELMRDVDQACGQENVQILGGHTQASRRVNDAVLTVTALGYIPKEGRLLSSSDVRPGMDILLTKWIALEGTAMLAKEKAELLRTRFAQPFIDRAARYSSLHSIQKEAAIARQAGAAALHDVEEGGIFGALWELAEASGVGLEIDLKKIPIRQETVEITEVFDVNPYKLLSGGCLLIAAEDGIAVKRELEKEGIPAKLIGVATDGNDRVLLHDGERRFLETVQTDEIYKVYNM